MYNLIKKNIRRICKSIDTRNLHVVTCTSDIYIVKVCVIYSDMLSSTKKKTNAATFKKKHWGTKTVKQIRE